MHLATLGEVVASESASQRGHSRLTFVAMALSDELLLQQATDLLSETERLAGIGTWVWYPVENNVIWSDHLYQILGYDSKTVEPSVENYFAVIHPEDLEDHQAVSQKALETNDPGDPFDCRMITPDGELKFIRVQGSAVKDDQGKIIKMYGLVHDRTDDHKRNLAQLEIEKLEAMKTYSQGVAHDFNNFLQLTMSSLRLINEEFSSTQNLEKIKGLLSIIEKSSTLSAELVRMMAYTDLGEPSDNQSIDVVEALDGMNLLLGAIVGDVIELKVSCLYTGSIHLDQQSFNQILFNLVKNSKEALGAGGKIEIRVEEIKGREKNPICVSVIDNGPGISEEHKKRIFEPFFTTKREYKGRGLGLSSVYRIVSAYGGEIQIESNERTAFQLYFESREQRVDRPLVTESADVKPLRILYVEDEPELREAFKSMLQMLSFRVESAEHGLAALEIYEQDTSFDVVITDVSMKKLDGVGLSKKIWELKPEQRIIFLTGFLHDLKIPEEAPQDRYRKLTKPITAESLVQVLAEFQKQK